MEGVGRTAASRRRRKKRRIKIADSTSKNISSNSRNISSNASNVEERASSAAARGEREPLNDVIVSSSSFVRSSDNSNNDSNNRFKRRRRTYGSRGSAITSTGSSNQNTSSSTYASSAVDELDFVDDELDEISHEKELLVRSGSRNSRIIGTFHRSLPWLLHLRELGLSSLIGKYRPMQSQSLNTCRQVGNIWGDCHGWWRSLVLCLPSDSSSPSWKWKSCVRRSIAFRALDTPPTDAVLALSRDASYMIALGGAACRQQRGTCTLMGDAGRPPMLALRFYGVPSVAALEHQEQQQRSSVSASPLFLTIPLLLDSEEQSENRNLTAPSSLLGESSSSAAANMPVRMLMSCDGAIGVAFLLHSTSATRISPELPNAALVGSPAVQDEDALGTIFIFRLPGSGGNESSVAVKSFKCANVRVAGNLRSHTLRNLLWPTNCIPLAGICSGTSAQSWCDGLYKTSSYGYLLLNDEDDGFRMTWITLGTNDDERRRSKCQEPISTKYSTKTSRSDIITTPDYEVWEGIWSERFSGCISPIPNISQFASCGIHIEYEAFFSIEALLSDIMIRRKKMFASCSSLPDYFYNLISVSDDGRVLKLVLVFALRKKRAPSLSVTSRESAKKSTPAAVGILLELDMFDLCYNEMEWVQHPTMSDSRFLRQWSNTLALNWRMRDRRVGLYSIQENCKGPLLQNYASKQISFHEEDAGADEAEDVDPSTWRRFYEVDGTMPPKHIAMSSLYPFCDVVTNKAVTSAEPVMRIACRNSPTSLSYN